MAARTAIRWEDISRDAESLFRIWTDGREVDWARKSWEALSKRGLTSYSNQIEWTRVMVRLMTLAAIYRDFCELAFDEVHEPEHAVWADELCLSSFRIAQCVGPQFHDDQRAEETQLLEDALAELLAGARSEIHGVLRAEFGDDSLLFVSLWNTVEYWRSEDLEAAGTGSTSVDTDIERDGDNQSNQQRPTIEIDWLENACGILNGDITRQKLAAHNWIHEGMQSVH